MGACLPSLASLEVQADLEHQVASILVSTALMMLSDTSYLTCSLYAPKPLILLDSLCLQWLVDLVLVYPAAPWVLGSAACMVATPVPSSLRMLDRQAPQVLAVLPWHSRSQTVYRGVAPSPLLLVLNTFPLNGYHNLPHQTRPLLLLNHLRMRIRPQKVTLCSKSCRNTAWCGSRPLM